MDVPGKADGRGRKLTSQNTGLYVTMNLTSNEILFKELVDAGYSTLEREGGKDEVPSLRLCLPRAATGNSLFRPAASLAKF
jgi:hypothetical protein